MADDTLLIGLTACLATKNDLIDKQAELLSQFESVIRLSRTTLLDANRNGFTRGFGTLMLINDTLGAIDEVRTLYNTQDLEKG